MRSTALTGSGTWPAADAGTTILKPVARKTICPVAGSRASSPVNVPVGGLPASSSRTSVRWP